MSFELFTDYLTSAKKQFSYYRQLGEKSISTLRDEELFDAPSEGSNSIAIMVKHLAGNMKSRWTELFTSDGEKVWRNRESEFELDFDSRETLINYWESGWHTLFEALDGIDENNFDQLVYIRNQGHTVIEAINRQLCHYSYHVGQIVFSAKMMKGDNWTSLSIAKGQSKDYNTEHFNQNKSKGHFTDNELEKE